MTSAAEQQPNPVRNSSSGPGAVRRSHFTSTVRECSLGVVAMKKSSPAYWTVVNLSLMTPRYTTPAGAMDLLCRNA